MVKQKKYNEMKSPQHIAKYIVRSHHPTLKPKPAKELQFCQLKKKQKIDV